MDIIVKRCNSIEQGHFSISENRLNIKYAINGTGKSTIAKAIEIYIKDKSGLQVLKPFKYRAVKDTDNPEIEGLDSINSVAIFDENYVNQYVFLPDELLKDSFSIFIRNDQYEKGIEEINDLIKSISETFEKNGDIEDMLRDLYELGGCLGTAKGLSKSSSFYKALGEGNKLENIPKVLQAYKPFIRHNENVRWLKWQMTGNDYVNISNICPYCTADGIVEKKETILAVKQNYDSKLIEHLNRVIGVVQRLKSYFVEDTYNKIYIISQSIDGLKEEQTVFMLEVREQINTLINKLSKIKSLGFSTLKDFDKISEIVKDYKVDLSYIGHLNSPETSGKIEKINQSLDEILNKAGILQGKVNKQKKHIENTIKDYKTEINNFLRYAGYNYQVDIIEDVDKQSYKMKLKHNDMTDSSIEKTKDHLSYGERNAFALVLFMFDAVKNNPDLIILDDPISSFDKNKKFAIIEMLFRGEKSLKNKSVLMLTHDFDPIIDMVYNLRSIFEPVPIAAYLENVEGTLIEKSIAKEDIRTFLDIAKENIENLDEQINKLIYLRRLLEIQDQKDAAYHLLSNIFHKREIPLYKAEGQERPMTAEEIRNGTQKIIKDIPEFDYKDCYDTVTNDSKLIELYSKASNNYEKLQIYRIINNDNSHNLVIKKFVNETFHIDNDYLYQLNPCKYQTVPSYIIKECDIDIQEIIQGITVI